MRIPHGRIMERLEKRPRQGKGIGVAAQARDRVAIDEHIQLQRNHLLIVHLDARAQQLWCRGPDNSNAPYAINHVLKCWL